MFTVPDERSHRLSVAENQKTKPKSTPDVATEILFGKSSAIPLTENKNKEMYFAEDEKETTSKIRRKQRYPEC